MSRIIVIRPDDPLWARVNDAGADGSVGLPWAVPDDVAAALGLAPGAVCLARVVSPYLTDTEEQIAALFEAAESTDAVLLLDEADALFGRRTEVSDVGDRYRDMETSYLLERIAQLRRLRARETVLRRRWRRPRLRW